MFTGLVEEIGTLHARTTRGPGAVLRIHTRLSPLVLGESIAVHGACLTVEHIVASGFDAFVSAETLSKTSLGRLKLGAQVHLERALPAHGRLGGHFVSGHIDGSAELISVEPVGDAKKITFRAPFELARFIAPKGSIAIDGVSLTVNQVHENTFNLMLVPYTQSLTVLSQLRPGDQVNIETDILAKYVVRYLQTGGQQRSESSEHHTKTKDSHDLEQRDELLLQRLRDAGFA